MWTTKYVILWFILIFTKPVFKVISLITYSTTLVPLYNSIITNVIQLEGSYG